MRAATIVSLASATAIALFAARARAAGGTPYRSIFRGITIEGGYAQGSYGRAVPGAIGAQTTGIETSTDRMLVWTWDTTAVATGGYGGNRHPGFWFFGGRTRLEGALGRRFVPDAALSPYGAARALLSISKVVMLDAAPGGPRAMNNVDGLVGESGTIATGLEFGLSHVRESRSWLLTAVMEEAVRMPVGWSSGRLYYEAGVHAEHDWAERASLMFEATYGVSPPRSESTFGSTTHARHVAARLVARFRPDRHFWLAVDGHVERDYQHVEYATSTIAYDTATIPSLAGALLFGWSFE